MRQKEFFVLPRGDARFSAERLEAALARLPGALDLGRGHHVFADEASRRAALERLAREPGATFPAAGVIDARPERIYVNRSGDAAVDSQIARFVRAVAREAPVEVVGEGDRVVSLEEALEP